MTIAIPEDRYLQGFYYLGTYTDSNEAITTSGLSTYFTLPQKGFQHARALFYNPVNAGFHYVYDIFTAQNQAFGLGGYISNTGGSWSARYANSGTTSMSIPGHFGPNIWLADCYIDDANERIVMKWDCSTGSQTLSATARFYAAKGSAV